MNTAHDPAKCQGIYFNIVTFICLIANFKYLWMVIEDLTFGDMYVFRWTTVPDFYMPYILGVPFMYFIQLNYLGADIHFDFAVTGYRLLSFKD